MVLLEIIVVIETIFIISVLYKQGILNINKKKKPIPPQAPLNLEADIHLLNFRIDRAIEQIETYKLIPCKISQVAVIGGRDYNKWKQEAIMSVCESLSPSYEQVLLRYFSTNGLKTYIVEEVSSKLTKKILDSNLRIK